MRTKNERKECKNYSSPANNFDKRVKLRRMHKSVLFPGNLLGFSVERPVDVTCQNPSTTTDDNLKYTVHVREISVYICDVLGFAVRQ